MAKIIIKPKNTIYLHTNCTSLNWAYYEGWCMVKEITLPVAMKGIGAHAFLLRISLWNVPGTLAKVAKLLADFNINILSSIISAPLSETEATMIAFVDFSRSTSTVDDVVEKLRELDVVREVEVVKPQIPGLLINKFMPILSVLGTRCIIIHVTGLSRILHYLYEKFGESAKVLMYYGGYGSIKDMVKGIRKMTGLGDLNLLNVCLQLFQSCGYGTFEITQFNIEPLHIVIRAYNLYECEPLKGKMSESNSQLFRGILAGLIEEIVNKKVIVIEDKCLAKGDPYCQFVIKAEE